uniref:Uncharacterized protein n=1 Tax=Romanomermis culicivorax TaxID=13658 RepID=A0A915K7L1_ROMCU
MNFGLAHCEWHWEVSPYAPPKSAQTTTRTPLAPLCGAEDPFGHPGVLLIISLMDFFGPRVPFYLQAVFTLRARFPFLQKQLSRVVTRCMFPLLLSTTQSSRQLLFALPLSVSPHHIPCRLL